MVNPQRALSATLGDEHVRIFGGQALHGAYRKLPFCGDRLDFEDSFECVGRTLVSSGEMLAIMGSAVNIKSYYLLAGDKLSYRAETATRS
jgi:hypothetical protein